MKNFRQRVEQTLRAYVPQTAEARDRVQAAVIVPFFEKQGKPHLLFTKRSSHLLQHSNEISFPGGKRSPEDEDLQATALRELFEEVAVPAGRVEIVGRLDAIRTLTTRFLVVPYVGFIAGGTPFTANQNEVEELLEVPYQHLLEPGNFRQEDRVFEGKRIIVYYFRWNEYTIWGLTGRILKSLMDLLGESI